MTFSDLNDKSRLEWDRSDMGRLLAEFPGQCHQAIEIGSRFEPGRPASRLRSAIVCGMGGSAIAGDVLAAWIGEGLAAPLLVHRNYGLPSWAGPQDLVIACSYSGETEETLSSYAKAGEAGCQRLAISTGGELERRCLSDDVPLIRIPGGMPPRCAFGYSLFPLAFGLSKAGLFEMDQVQLFEAVDTVERLAQECHWGAPADGNPAGRIAMHLHDSIPVIYASADRLGPVARRWANQINENAKQPSYYAFQPELCHNEVVGWEMADGPARRMAVVMLGDPSDHGRNALRAQAVAGIIGDAVRAVVRLEGKGESRLARIMYLIHLGDWVSYYLAWLNRADPTPIAPIVKLKNILKEAK